MLYEFGDFTQSIKESLKYISLIKHDCPLDFLNKCKDTFADTKLKINIFSNYLLSKNYKAAREYIATLGKSYYNSMSCGFN